MNTVLTTTSVESFSVLPPGQYAEREQPVLPGVESTAFRSSAVQLTEYVNAHAQDTDARAIASCGCDSLASSDCHEQSHAVLPQK